MRRIVLSLLMIAFSCISIAFANGATSKSAPNARTYFISPTNGQTVPQQFKLQFGLSGMGVAPAGINKDQTGHHHLLIDTDISAIDLSKPLPATDNIKHFGGGQTETELQLAPGKHTLQLLLGDYLHTPHNQPVISEKITIHVE